MRHLLEIGADFARGEELTGDDLDRLRKEMPSQIWAGYYERRMRSVKRKKLASLIADCSAPLDRDRSGIEQRLETTNRILVALLEAMIEKQE